MDAGARQGRLGLGERGAVSGQHRLGGIQLRLPQREGAGVGRRLAAFAQTPEPFVLRARDARLFRDPQQLNLLHGHAGARLLDPAAVVGVVDAEDQLALAQPPAALEAGGHPHDPARDFGSDVNAGARADRAGAVHGNGAAAGNHGGRGGERDARRHGLLLGLGSAGNEDIGHGHASDEDDAGKQEADYSAHRFGQFSACCPARPVAPPACAATSGASAATQAPPRARCTARRASTRSRCTPTSDDSTLRSASSASRKSG